MNSLIVAEGVMMYNLDGYLRKNTMTAFVKAFNYHAKDETSFLRDQSRTKIKGKKNKENIFYFQLEKCSDRGWEDFENPNK
jgi:hypothetical protein